MAFGSKALAKFLKKKGKEVLEDLTDKPTVKKATPSKAEESKVTGSTQEKPKGEKKKSGAGRKRKARGAEPATAAEKAGAKKAGMGVRAFRALPVAEQKKWLREAGKLGKSKAAPGPARTPREDRELEWLKKEQQREMDATLRPQQTSVGIRRMRLTPEGQRLFDAGEFDEIIKNPKKYMTHGIDAPLRPKGTGVTKAQLAKMKKGSPSDKAQAVREMLNDPGYVVATPTQAKRLMGGEADVPPGTEADIRRLTKGEGGPGFEIEAEKRGGGRLKYYKKGGRIKKSSKKPRGVGVALRGYGRALKRGQETSNIATEGNLTRTLSETYIKTHVVYA